MAKLSVYGTSVAASTLPNAGLAATATAGGTDVGITTKIGTASGWGEIPALGSTAAWPSASVIGNPSGLGWLLDSALLANRQLEAGNIAPQMTCRVTSGSIVITAVVGIYAYDTSNSSYSLIGTVSLANQTISSTRTTYIFPSTALPAFNFNATQRLYYHLWVNITSNSTGSSSATLSLRLSTTGTAGVAGDMEIDFPGYTAAAQINNPYSPYGVTIAPIKNNPPTMPTQLPSDMANWSTKAIIRNNYLWRSNETAPGVYNWTSYLDNFVSQCNAAGITALLSINGAPAWYLALDDLGNYIGPTTTIASYTTTGGPYTSIAVNALPAGTSIPNGTQMLIDVEGTQETITTSAAVSAGATAIPINSWTPAGNHTSGVHVVAAASVLPDPAAMANYASLVATRYNGANGHGSIQIFQVGNEEYDSFPNPDPNGYRDLAGKWLALTIQSVAPAIRAAAPGALILAGAVRKVTTNALSHVENWLGNLCTYNGGVNGLIDAVDFHYYRGGSSAGPDPTTSDANTPSISQQLAAMKSVLATNSTLAEVWCCEFGWDMYDDGNGTQSTTTATLNAATAYSSIPVAALPSSIANATPITIDYKAATYANQEIVYAYGQAAKNATTVQITTNPLGNGAAQSAWTAQVSHTSGCKVYAQNSVTNIYTQEQVRGWTIEMYDAMRTGGGGMCLCYTDNPNSIVHTNALPISAVETKSLFQSVNSAPTYMTAYSNPSQSPGPGTKEYAALHPSWYAPPTNTGSAYAQLILSANPKAYYRLDESGGLVAYDSSGNGYNGTYTGISAYNVAGAIYGDPDAALSFTANGGLSVPYSQINPDSWSAASIEFWVNLGANWHYVAVAVDASGTSLYLDGALTSAGSGAAIDVLQALDAVGSFVASGTLDEVAIYNTKLSLALVQSHYAAGIGSSGAYGSGAYTTYIGGAPVFVDAGTLTIDSTIGKRSTAQMTVHTIGTGTHYQQDQQVSIYDKTGTLVFSGYVATPKETKPGFQSSLETQIQCVDQHRLADKRVVAASYTNQTCGAIATDLLNKILSQEGVSIGQIFDGLTPATTLYPSSSLYPGGNVGLVPQAVFVYCTVAQALDALVNEASSAGVPYYWMIDQNKLLWFVPYTAVVNSTVIDGTQIEHVKTPAYVTRANPTYRNTQYVTGGVAQTVLQVESRVGDGTTQSWAMGYGLAQAPTITVNGNAQTVGIKGMSASGSFQFYWAQGDPVITQDSNQAKLTGGDVLQVTYYGQYPTTYLAQNDAQISYEAGLDGTSGIVEEVEQNATITSETAGLSTASNLLTRYGVQGLLLEFSTLQTGFAPGQLVTVDLSMHGINNAQLLIEEVSASDQADSLNIWYAIKAVMGPYDVMWQDFFNNLVTNQTPANSINVGVGQSLNLLASFSTALTPTATLGVNAYVCPLPATTLYPGSTLYGC